MASEKAQQINLLYVADSGMISSTGGGRTRITSAAKQAAKNGFAVTLLCFCTPGQIIRFSSLLVGRRKLASDSQCAVYYLPRLPLTRLRWICVLNDWYCGLAVFLLCLAFRIRVVHAQTLKPAVFGLIARKIKSNIKVIADIHGATMEEYLYETERSHIDATAWHLEKYEEKVLRNADWIVFVSQAMRGYYEERFGERYDNSSIIPCATNGVVDLLKDRRQLLRLQRGLNEKFVVCYVGSGDTYQSPREMCALFKSISQVFTNAFFLILSHHRGVFEDHLAKSGVDSANYSIDAVNQAEVFELLQLGDVGLLLRDQSIINRVASPTKFAEYCACGVPVIATKGIGDFSEWVQQHRVGWITDLADVGLNNEMASFLLDVQARRQEYIRRCSLFARSHLAWDRFGSELANIYSSLLQDSRLKRTESDANPALDLAHNSSESTPSA